MTVSIIVPAYNINPALAKKFEEDIARVMHAKREEEINQFRDVKLPPKAGRYIPPLGEARIPDDNRKTDLTKGRENNDTDHLILKLLRQREMTVAQVAHLIGLSRQVTRHLVTRLVARKELVRIKTYRNDVFRTVGEETHV